MRNRLPKKLKICLAVTLIGLLGYEFEDIGRDRDQSRYEQVGNSVNVGGRTMNISCLGQGSPAVVFDTSGHQSGYAWIAVQSEVAKHTRACWYDRAGYGWSELGPEPRTFQAIASDLHFLLREAGVSFPVVLVGAGDAASHIRVYYGNYPTEVEGVVMLDANDVDDASVTIPNAIKGGFDRALGSWAAPARGAACWMRPFLGGVGAIRFANLFAKPRRTNSFGLTEEQQAELDNLSDNATTKQASELCAREESMAQVRAAGNLKDVPLLVVASRADQAADSHNPVEVAWKEYRIHQIPRALSSLSTRSRVVLIDADLKTDAIVRSILEVIRTAQGSI